MKKSYFGRYFLYNLKGHIGFIAASFILALGGIPALTIMLRAYLGALEPYYSTDGYIPTHLNDVMYLISGYAALVVPICLAGSMILAVISPAIFFKFYNNRACVDTLGSLPLTYKERFFGDFLSGIITAAAPILLLMPVSYILLSDINRFNIEEVQVGFNSLSTPLLILPIIIISAYAFSTLIVSCCGSIGSSIFYSFLGIAVVPVILSSYTALVCSCGIGLSAEDIPLLGAVAPGGISYEFIQWLMNNPGMFMSEHGYPEKSAVSYIIIAVLTAAYVVGAYFIGKHRRTERVGRDFTYNSAYSVMSMALLIAMYGILLIGGATAYIPFFFCMLVVIAAFLAIEFSHTKSVKKLPRSLIKLAAISAVCFGFYAVTIVTKGFGYSDNIPDPSEISSVEVSSYYIYSPDDKPMVYDTEESIKGIVSVHKDIISDKSKIRTGNEIVISYKLKNGLSLNRGYTTFGEDYEMIKNATAEILSYPTSTKGLYGILESNDYSKISVSGAYYIEETVDEATTHHTNFVVKPSKIDEFKKILLDDIKENYIQYSRTVGAAEFYYTKDGKEYHKIFNILDTYENTIKFLKDAENVSDPLSPEENVNKLYYVQLYLDNNDPYGDNNDTYSGEREYILVYFNSDSDTAKELISLCVSDTSDELSENIKVAKIDNYTELRIRKSDEKRAAELILQIFKNQIENVF